MKTEKNILIAFLLNFSFAIFEFFGGMITGSVAIMSDAVHDAGDALSIGVSWWCERKSKQKEDNVYTYGYARYSIVGSVIITVILLIGSITVLISSTKRLFSPVAINYDGMIVFGIVGVILNAAAAFFTKEGDSVNQRAVNLHMLEDVLGWIVVLIGAIVMKFTDISLIDPIMSIAVTIFVAFQAVEHLKEALEIFLEKVPHDIHVEELKEHMMNIDGVQDVHHIHIWTMDGLNNYATLHIVTNEHPQEIKKKIREVLAEHNICHVTIEVEMVGEMCGHDICNADENTHSVGHHSHTHHNHKHAN